MRDSDIPAVARLEGALFGAEAWSPHMLASELACQPGSRHYLVAESDGDVCGYGGLMSGGGQADVVTLAVASRRWGEGIGAILLGALLAEAVRRGAAEVFLEVRVDNERAQRLYRRHGFEVVGLRRGYYQPSGADALVMRRVASAGHDSGRS
jgi:ribosomal-protein-alanine N-acetyltransferase